MICRDKDAWRFILIAADSAVANKRVLRIITGEVWASRKCLVEQL